MNRHDPAHLLSEAQRALHVVDPAAFLVRPRVLRRVIMQDRELTGLSFRVPHRKGYVISGDRLAMSVDRDELGLAADAAYPTTAILLVRPDEKELGKLPLPEFMAQIWRLLFHARVHIAYDARQLTAAEVRERIAVIGQLEFDELSDVLRRENFLFANATPTDIYVEFAAVYLEARQFAPHWLPVYFPLLTDRDKLDSLLRRDVDYATIFASTRPAHAVDPATRPELTEDGNREAALPRLPSTPHERRYRSWITWSERAMSRGNSVAAAIGFLTATQYAPSGLANEAHSRSRKSIDKLVRRLQAALGFDDEAAKQWRRSIQGLLGHAVQGFWNPDKRLLYDLQKVCIDHERVVFTVDLWKWITSLGDRPIKRALPNQREVLMSKHLRRATSRLVAARLSGLERERLSRLLNEAAELAEQQMRRHLRPLVQQALDDVEMRPRNVPERVSAKKIVEELLDVVARRGYLTMGYFRDTISRNNVKVMDLKSPLELITGDQLLRADRQLDKLLDGVYHRGEIYMRLLQSLSSLGFGTGVGRLLTKFVAIPFGGAAVGIEFTIHLGGKFISVSQPLVDWLKQVFFRPEFPFGWGALPEITNRILLEASAVFLLGMFILGMIHLPRFRRFVLRTGRWLYRGVKGIAYDLPTWLLRHRWVRVIWRSPPVLALRRYVLRPVLLTLIFAVGFPFLFRYPPPTQPLMVAMFLTFNLLLNSRIGRDFEEVTAEWLSRTWYRIRVHIIVALFELVMETFKRMLEGLERILYAVDEWLRFRSGETTMALVVKAVLGIVWSVVNFVVRFVVGLLIEPQINPIKHFPVVTVSHKFLLPLAYTSSPPTIPSPLASVVMYFSSDISIGLANGIAATVVWGIPGIFGFLVWELKENWRLYDANRIKQLQPVAVGEHGESLPRLLNWGFHSGTLPKLFAKRRRATREDAPEQYLNQLAERRDNVEKDVRRFVERELFGLLAESSAWKNFTPIVSQVLATADCIQITIQSPAGGLPWRLVFQEQSGWLMVGTSKSGWIQQLDEERRQVLERALQGFYQLSGVDLVQEQIARCFEPQSPTYHVVERNLVVWPDGQHEVAAKYSLTHHGRLRPEPATLAKQFPLPTLDAEQLVFAHSSISWSDWVKLWTPEKEIEHART